MKSPRFVGQMLAVCLPGLALGLTAFPGSSVANPSSIATPLVEELSIFHQETRAATVSVSEPIVAQVRRSLQDGRANAADGWSTNQVVRAALSDAYPERVSETNDPMHYRLEYVEGLGFVLVCYNRFNFVVDFDSQGHVEVELIEKHLY